MGFILSPFETRFLRSGLGLCAHSEVFKTVVHPKRIVLSLGTPLRGRRDELWHSPALGWPPSPLLPGLPGWHGDMLGLGLPGAVPRGGGLSPHLAAWVGFPANAPVRGDRGGDAPTFASVPRFYPWQEPSLRSGKLGRCWERLTCPGRGGGCSHCPRGGAALMSSLISPAAALRAAGGLPGGGGTGRDGDNPPPLAAGAAVYRSHGSLGLQKIKSKCPHSPPHPAPARPAPKPVGARVGTGLCRRPRRGSASGSGTLGGEGRDAAPGGHGRPPPPPCPGAAPKPRSRPSSHPASGGLLSRVSPGPSFSASPPLHAVVRAGVLRPGSLVLRSSAHPSAEPRGRGGRRGRPGSAAWGRRRAAGGDKNPVPFPVVTTYSPKLKDRAVSGVGPPSRGLLPPAPHPGRWGGGGAGPGWYPRLLPMELWSILALGGMGRGRLWDFPPQGRFSWLAGLQPTYSRA